jgi:hypothetical protein
MSRHMVKLAFVFDMSAAYVQVSDACSQFTRHLLNSHHQHVEAGL